MVFIQISQEREQLMENTLISASSNSSLSHGIYIDMPGDQAANHMHWKLSW